MKLLGTRLSGRNGFFINPFYHMVAAFPTLVAAPAALRCIADFQSASAGKFADLADWKSATQQVWKPALLPPYGMCIMFRRRPRHGSERRADDFLPSAFSPSLHF